MTRDYYAERKARKLFYDEVERLTGKRQAVLRLDDPLYLAFVRYISSRE